jgi:hypothetical protein
MILQAIPSISTNEWYFTLIPLSIMVSLGMLKEAISDLKRFLADKKVNGAPTNKVLSRSDPSSSFDGIEAKWPIMTITTQQVKVGDILAIKDD